MLLNAGYTVIVYDLFLNGVMPLLSYCTSSLHLHLVKGDVLDKEHLKSVMSNNTVDIIIHLAAVVGNSTNDYVKILP